GRLLMLLADAPVARRGRPFLRGRGTLGVASLDGRDLASCEGLLLAPFAPGRYELATQGHLAMEAGELRDGRWVSLDETRPGHDHLRLRADDVSWTLMMLACRPEHRARWRARLEELATHPWDVRGY
ncbi:MAG: hypothetical protein J7M26_07430, partial [Armatimonadetes bacterium]|nr:hypothetical protein [Armatimonadota bacterium]